MTENEIRFNNAQRASLLTARIYKSVMVTQPARVFNRFGGVLKAL
jgi:hypothetical protein